MKDLTILLEDKPGTLAEVSEVLGQAGINIEGGCGYPAIGRGIFHILVEDVIAARTALEGAGITVSEENDVIVFNLDNKPGNLGAELRKLSNEGINATLFYIASNNRIVLSVDDFDKARSLIG
ncbi:MAG: hypothetical protein HeimC2_07520 [Candidatus Heimdallarchaeota archaeon LC_2]|nr:MAG: hypothetical protein HeimC2_07520 [Candidatus Heimdallarchaeota archaeon LC_2]